MNNRASSARTLDDSYNKIDTSKLKEMHKTWITLVMLKLFIYLCIFFAGLRTWTFSTF